MSHFKIKQLSSKDFIEGRFLCTKMPSNGMNQRQILFLHLFSLEHCWHSGYLRKTGLRTHNQNDLSLTRVQYCWGLD